MYRSTGNAEMMYSTAWRIGHARCSATRSHPNGIEWTNTYGCILTTTSWWHSTCLSYFNNTGIRFQRQARLVEMQLIRALNRFFGYNNNGFDAIWCWCRSQPLWNRTRSPTPLSALVHIAGPDVHMIEAFEKRSWNPAGLCRAPEWLCQYRGPLPRSSDYRMGMTRTCGHENFRPESPIESSQPPHSLAAVRQP